MKKKLLIAIIPLLALIGIGATIQWYHQATGGTPADGQTMLVENAASNNYVQFKLSALKTYILPSNSAGVLTNDGAGTLSWVPVNTLISNVFNNNVFNSFYSTNSFFTNTFSSNIFTTNFYSAFSTIIQLTVQNITITNNLTATGKATINQLIVTNGPFGPTNSFGAATNNLDMSKQNYFFASFTPMEISGLINLSNDVVQKCELVVSNAAATNWNLTGLGNLNEVAGLTSGTVTNGAHARLWVEFSKGAGTGAVFRAFPH